MFKFARERVVLWPVEATVPAEDGTGTRSVKFSIRYKLLTRDELAEISREALRSFGATDIDQQIEALSDERLREETDRLRRHVVGWAGIVDENDQPLAFTTDNLDAILAVPYLYRTISAGLIAASSAAPVKNSKPGHDSMPVEAQNTAAPVR
jgi:hypothetical protein